MGLFDDLQERRPFGFSMASPSRLPSIRRPGASTKARPNSMIEAPTQQDARVSPPPTASPSGGPKIPKRRSLLPQFPPRKTSADYSPTELSKVEESDKTSGTAMSFNEDLRDAVEAADRKAMPPPSKLGRPMSSYGGTGIRPPSRQPNHTRDASVNKAPLGREEALKMLSGSSSGGAARAHARAQSTQTTGLQRTGSTKLPQSPAVAPKGHIRAPSIKAPTTQTGVATGTATRRPGTSGRPVSTSIGSTHAKKSSREASPPSPARPTSSARTQMPRPAFNTYQQHYSPAKTGLPKPPIPSTRSSRSPSVVSDGGNGMISTETCWKEQIELLQLSMLHQQSLLSTAEFEKDAEEKLGRKHGKLQRELESVKSLEREQKRMANLTAVGAWSPDAELLVENMLILGRVHSELSTLTQDEGRYDELVSVFEAWMEDAEAAFSGARGGFVENLPDVWRTTHTSLALKLRALQRDMEMLPRVPRGEAEKSSIGVVIRSCWEMLEGIVRELEVMSKLERVMLEKEKTRVEEDVLLTAEEAIGMKKDDWVPAWQSVAQ